MRKLGVVVLFAISHLLLAGEAGEFSLAAYSLRSPHLQWLSLVSDQIVRKPMLTAKQACGSQAGCALVTANVRWQCESVGSRAFAATDAAVRLYGTIYYYPGRLPAALKPFDRSVIDGFTALAHEYQWHIIPAASSVTPLLTKFQSESFPTRDACEVAGKNTSIAVTTTFRQRLAETQRNEMARRPVASPSSGAPVRAMLEESGPGEG